MLGSVRGHRELAALRNSRSISTISDIGVGVKTLMDNDWGAIPWVTGLGGAAVAAGVAFSAVALARSRPLLASASEALENGGTDALPPRRPLGFRFSMQAGASTFLR